MNADVLLLDSRHDFLDVRRHQGEDVEMAQARAPWPTMQVKDLSTES